MTKIIKKTPDIKESEKPESDKLLKEIDQLKIRLKGCEDFLEANAKAIFSIFSVLIPKNDVSKKE